MQFVQITRNVTDMIPKAMRKKMPLTKKIAEHYQVEKKDASGDATEGTEKGPKKLNEKEYDAIRSDYEK